MRPVCHLVSHFLVWTGYKDLQTRKETREMAWSKPGWDECVAYTGKINGMSPAGINVLPTYRLPLSLLKIC
jgi:hypothetical protein